MTTFHELLHEQLEKALLGFSIFHTNKRTADRENRLQLIYGFTRRNTRPIHHNTISIYHAR